MTTDASAASVAQEARLMQREFSRMHLRHARFAMIATAFVGLVAQGPGLLDGTFKLAVNSALDLFMVVYCAVGLAAMHRGWINERNVDIFTFVVGAVFLVNVSSAAIEDNNVVPLVGIGVLLVAFGLIVIRPVAYVVLSGGGLAGIFWLLAVLPDPSGIADSLWFGTITAATAGLLCFVERRVSYSHILRLQAESNARAAALEVQNRMATESAEAARAANKAKEIFLANMSHELRTPLTAIMGVVDLLSQTRVDAEQESYLAMARTNGRMLLNILNDILDLSKLEAGKLTLVPEPFDARSTTADVASLLALSAERKGLVLTHRIAKDVPERVMCDPMRIRQILFNLIGNAIKYTDQGSIEITLEAQPMADGRQQLIWRVKDTGAGIPSDRLDSLFVRFEAGTPGAVQRADSTGLGLSICRQLTDLMGGTIVVTSEVGKGSVFKVAVPVTVVSAAASPRKTRTRAATGRLAGLEILVAEDNQVNQLLVRRILEREGAIVTMTENGAEAVREASSAPFDAILMDIQMPVMDGVMATKSLKAAVQTSAIPVIALTANAFDSDRERYFAVGMTGFVSKPIDIPHLISEIIRLVPEKAQPQVAE